MRAAILEQPQKIVIREIPEPVPPPGGLVLEIQAALTCGTDVKTFLRGHPKIPLPAFMGHEFSGVVIAVGEECDKFVVGDEIMSVHSAPCLDCFYCRQELHNLCEFVMETMVLGAYAERIALPAHILEENAFCKPPGISFAQAAFLEPLSCVVHGARQAQATAGETVIVFGAGAIGQLFAMLLRAEGCLVMVIEPHEKRRQMAAKLGADLVLPAGDEALDRVLEFTGGYGADLAVECTGQPEVWEDTIRYMRRGGRVLLFGGTPPETKVCFDAAWLHYNQIHLLSSFHFTPADVAQAAELLGGGRLDPSPLITGSTTLDGLALTLKMLARGEGIKILVRP